MKRLTLYLILAIILTGLSYGVLYFFSASLALKKELEYETEKTDTFKDMYNDLEKKTEEIKMENEILRSSGKG